MNATLYICGPADGSVAYSFPQFQKSSDDTLFLASSECELAEGQMVFRLYRTWVNGTPVLRVAFYQQVFEQGMSRLGHSFAAVFEFEKVAPIGKALAQTLIELAAVIKQNCVTDKHFCSAERFVKFLSHEIEPSYAGIIDQLDPTTTRTIIGIPLENGQQLQLFSEELLTSIERLGSLIDWFAQEPAAALCETLLIGSHLKVVPSFRPLLIEEVSNASFLHLYKTAETLHLAQREAKSNQAEGQKTIAFLQQECEVLRRRNSTLEHENRSSDERIQLLKQEITIRPQMNSYSDRAASAPSTSHLPTNHLKPSAYNRPVPSKAESTFDRQQIRTSPILTKKDEQRPVKFKVEDKYKASSRVQTKHAHRKQDEEDEEDERLRGRRNPARVIILCGIILAALTAIILAWFFIAPTLKT